MSDALRSHTKAELYEKAQDLNVPGRGSMSKADLAEAIETAQSFDEGRYLTGEELREKAREQKIKGRSKMSVDDLRERLQPPPSDDVQTKIGRSPGEPRTKELDPKERMPDDWVPVVYKQKFLGLTRRKVYAAVSSDLFWDEGSLKGRKYQGHIETDVDAVLDSNDRVSFPPGEDWEHCPREVLERIEKTHNVDYDLPNNPPESGD